jgi:hypothetical protein
MLHTTYPTTYPGKSTHGYTRLQPMGFKWSKLSDFLCFMCDVLEPYATNCMRKNTTFSIVVNQVTKIQGFKLQPTNEDL